MLPFTAYGFGCADVLYISWFRIHFACVVRRLLLGGLVRTHCDFVFHGIGFVLIGAKILQKHVNAATITGLQARETGLHHDHLLVRL